MYKLYKCIMIALLAACMLLTVGCKNEPEASEPSGNQVIQLPDGMEVEFGVDSRDDEDVKDETPDTNQDTDTDDNKPDDNDPDDNKPDDNDPDDNKPDDNDPDDNKPDDNKPDDNKPDNNQVPAPGTIDFEAYLALDPDQQDMYIESFESLSAFNKWYNEARAEYESQIPDETIDGPIDLDKYNP